MLLCLSISIALGIGGIFIYIYYQKKGQFEDPEEVKYQMFHEDDHHK